jgi:hypothetical protein
MPYSVSKRSGGDSSGNDAWMERCVAKVQAGGQSKESAIRICKANLERHKGTVREIHSGLLKLKGAKR